MPTLSKKPKAVAKRKPKAKGAKPKGQLKGKLMAKSQIISAGEDY